MRLKGESEDIVAGFLDSASRLVLGAGTLALLGGIGFLLYYFFTFAGTPPPDIAQAKRLVDQFTTVGTIGALLFGIGLTWVWWGEDVLSVILVLISGALYFSPLFMPGLVGGNPQEIAALSLKSVQHIGGILGILAIGVTVIDVSIRIRSRLQHGAKADSLKYGKGVKEDLDRQNVLLGKCWQLPYCRKFVRDKCPIYHSKRTCWKERVGCMCEEKVIQNAMQGVNIPRDMVAAAKFIPYNTKLPMEVKIQRCRQCVIYNEHQKHKYKVALPATLLGVIGLWFLIREPLKEVLGTVLTTADRFIGQATMLGKQGVTNAAALNAFREVLVVLLMIMLLAYLLKMLEFLIFKIKV